MPAHSAASASACRLRSRRRSPVHGAKAVFIVSNNAAWNIERYDQEANYGGRVVGTTLRHSDYAAMARALGAHGERVEDAGQIVDALKRALANAPALLDVV